MAPAAAPLYDTVEEDVGGGYVVLLSAGLAALFVVPLSESGTRSGVLTACLRQMLRLWIEIRMWRLSSALAIPLAAEA